MPGLQSAPLAERFLPFDVRYALRYRAAELTVEEIVLLANSTFENEAAYLLLKLASYDPMLQLRLLQFFVRAVLSARNLEAYTNEDTRAAIRWFVNTQASIVRQDITVGAGKLAQISRQGFTYWDSLYRQSAERLSRDTRDTYVIGHSTFIGLAAYVQAHELTGKVLRVIIPPYVTDPDMNLCGYTMLGEVSHLTKDFPRSRKAVLVDDTKHSGACMRRMQELWSTDRSESPSFEFFTIVDKDAVCGT